MPLYLLEVILLLLGRGQGTSAIKAEEMYVLSALKCSDLPKNMHIVRVGSSIDQYLLLCVLCTHLSFCLSRRCYLLEVLGVFLTGFVCALRT